MWVNHELFFQKKILYNATAFKFENIMKNANNIQI